MSLFDAWCYSWGVHWIRMVSAGALCCLLDFRCIDEESIISICCNNRQLHRVNNIPLCTCFHPQTLNYLKVVYKTEWANFVERILTRSDVIQYWRENEIRLLPAAEIAPSHF